MLVSTLKGSWQALQTIWNQIQIIATHVSSLNQPWFFTEEGRITPLSLYGKSPKWITHSGHPCVMAYHTYCNQRWIDTHFQWSKQGKGKPNVIQQTTLKWRTTLKQGEFSLRTPSISCSKSAERHWCICTTITRGLKHLQTWIKQIKSNVNWCTKYG